MKDWTDVRTYGLTYVYVRTYVRTIDDVMAIKPNLLASMGYQYFLSYDAVHENSIINIRKEGGFYQNEVAFSLNFIQMTGN